MKIVLNSDGERRYNALCDDCTETCRQDAIAVIEKCPKTIAVAKAAKAAKKRSR